MRGWGARGRWSSAGGHAIQVPDASVLPETAPTPPHPTLHPPPQLWRESLQAEGFIEIHTPKLLAGASEGGAAVFRFDYMGRPGCLAQSPQFYKQVGLWGAGRVHDCQGLKEAGGETVQPHCALPSTAPRLAADIRSLPGCALSHADGHLFRPEPRV